PRPRGGAVGGVAPPRPVTAPVGHREREYQRSTEQASRHPDLTVGKRLFDLVVSLLLCVVAVPVVAVVALGAAASLRCWPFFVQERVGTSGRPLRFVKVRTLPAATPRYADKYGLSDVAIPPFPALLRRWHLDELPQLFLVPFGRLSLVGPRPEMPHLHARMARRFAETRTSVRPGCTGLWQIGAGAERLILETPQYDLFYLAHGNLRLDLWILWRTVLLFSGLGRPVELGDVPRWARGRTPPQQRSTRFEVA
ncbi:MAG TPA: sugar transferase, partial [Nitriliruptorales bacterium]|nr:sugar transferase [Nitriliruptorales bacterium]